MRFFDRRKGDSYIAVVWTAVKWMRTILSDQLSVSLGCQRCRGWSIKERAKVQILKLEKMRGFAKRMCCLATSSCTDILFLSRPQPTLWTGPSRRASCLFLSGFSMAHLQNVFRAVPTTFIMYHWRPTQTRYLFFFFALWLLGRKGLVRFVALNQPR